MATASPACRRASSRGGTSANAPFAVIADEKRKYLRRACSIPRWCTRPTAPSCCATSCAISPGCKGDWTMAAFREEAIEKIREQVGKGRVICGLSGGVDSSVAAVLIHEAIGDQLTCVFVDHGLMRLDEGEDGRRPVPRSLQHPAGACGCARSDSWARSTGVTDPEAKRKTIGRLFIDVFEEEAKKIGGARFPGAGHALSRRDRERVVHRRAVGHHQEPPQCRRPARAHEHEAGRAAARAVQGRGAGARAANWACPKIFVGRHPFPGPALRSAARRDHARKARHPAQGRRHLSRRDPQGRPLRRDLAGLCGAAAGARRSA